MLLPDAGQSFKNMDHSTCCYILHSVSNSAVTLHQCKLRHVFIYCRERLDVPICRRCRRQSRKFSIAKALQKCRIIVGAVSKTFHYDYTTMQYYTAINKTIFRRENVIFVRLFSAQSIERGYSIYPPPKYKNAMV